jgi:hypothetical protein
MHVWNDTLYFVAGTALYSATAAAPTPVQLATGIASSTNKVDFANNIDQLAFVQGDAHVYVWDGTTLTDVAKYSTEVAITQIVNSAGTTYTVTSTAHGSANGDKVVITGTTNFNREYTVANSAANTYDITHINSTDADETGLTDAAGYYRLAADSFVITPSHIEYMDTYGIINTTTADSDNGIEKNSFLVSLSGDFRVWLTTNGGAAQRFPDALIAMTTYQGALYLVCEQSTESYYNVGEGTQPFQPYRQSALMWGALSNGQITVVYQENYAMRPISNNALDYRLSQATLAQLEAATAFSYREEGSDFYVLTFGNETWTLDVSASLSVEIPIWHERQDYQGNKARPKYYAYLTPQHLVSDHTESKILEMDRDTYTELVGSTAQAMTVEGYSGIIHNNDERLFHHDLYLDMENPVGTGTVELFYSDDGGHNYTSLGSVSFTGRGTRPEWHGLGMAETDRIYKFVFTGNVARPGLF